MRLPVDALQPFIPQICEGVLLWCEDSKNKFRLKVNRPAGWLLCGLASTCFLDAPPGCQRGWRMPVGSSCARLLAREGSSWLPRWQPLGWGG